MIPCVCGHPSTEHHLAFDMAPCQICGCRVFRDRKRQEGAPSGSKYVSASAPAEPTDGAPSCEPPGLAAIRKAVRADRAEWGHAEALLSMVDELTAVSEHDRRKIEELRAELDEAREIVRRIRGLVDEERYPSLTKLAREAVARWKKEEKGKGITP
jgi:Arc/MetJ-type ribon-helix-helix transcriptional regulator